MQAELSTIYLFSWNIRDCQIFSIILGNHDYSSGMYKSVERYTYQDSSVVTVVAALPESKSLN